MSDTFLKNHGLYDAVDQLYTTTVPSLSNSVSTLNTSYSTLNTTVANLGTSYNTLNTTVANLRTSYNTLNTTVANINTATGDISGIRTRLSTLETSYNTLNTTVGSAYTYAMSAYNNSSVLFTSVSDIQNNISSINTNISVLQSFRDSLASKVPFYGTLTYFNTKLTNTTLSASLSESEIMSNLGFTNFDKTKIITDKLKIKDILVQCSTYGYQLIAPEGTKIDVAYTGSYIYVLSGIGTRSTTYGYLPVLVNINLECGPDGSLKLKQNTTYYDLFTI